MTAGEHAERTLADLGALVAAARVDPDHRLTMEQAAAEGGMSPTTWRRIERDFEPARPMAYSSVERVLDWPNGSIAHYLAGGAEPRRNSEVRVEEALALAQEAQARLEAENDELRRENETLRAHRDEVIRRTDVDDLLAEVSRRYHSAAGASPVRSGGEETAESARARGGRPVRPMGRRSSGASWEDAGPSGVSGQP